MEFGGVLHANFLSADGKGHAGTILSAAAWLAGTSLYRSLGYKQNPAPGTIMLSNEVDEEWPILLNIFLLYCRQYEIQAVLGSVAPSTDYPSATDPIAKRSWGEIRQGTQVNYRMPGTHRSRL